MSTPDPSLEPIVHKDWLERASDFFNPILVKETRQSLKSRSFVTVFILMLIASWMISAIGVLYVYGPELPYAAAGRNFFSAFYMVLAIAVFMVVPQGAFRSIQSERDLQTFEMLTITTLSPRQIVWGKWWSATVQTIVYYAAIAPFMVFTNLLRGISLPFIAFVLIWSFIGSVTLAMLAIMFSTFTKQRQAFGVLQFLLVMPMVSSLWGLLALMFEISGTELPVDQPWFWLVQAIILSLLIPAFILFRQIATANLTFEGANRSTGVRISCLVLLVVALGWMLLLTIPGLLPSSWGIAGTVPTAAVTTWCSLLGLWLWVVGLYASTEDDRLSRRVRQESPRGKAWRLLILPFFPGGGRGFLYFLISGGLLWGTGTFVIAFSTGSSDEQLRGQTTMLAVAGYLLFYVGLASFLGRCIRRVGSDLHASHARVLGILIAAAGIIGPYLFVFWDYRFPQSSPIVMVTNPLQSCYNFIFNSNDAPPLFVVILMGAVGLLLNIRNVLRGISEFLTLGPEPRPAANETFDTQHGQK